MISLNVNYYIHFKNVNHNEIPSSFQSEEEEINKVPLYKILQKNSPEWKYLLLGCIGSLLFGAYPPLFGYSLGGVFDVSM